LTAVSIFDGGESSIKVRTTIVLAIIVLVGAALRIWGIGFGLPAVLARPDENVILEVAVNATSGDLNPKFFTYPTGFIYLLAALFHITVPLFSPPHPIDPAWSLQTLYAIWPDPFFLTGRWTVAIMGILSLPLIYLIGKRLGGCNLGLLAAWFFAVAPIPVRDAHFSVSDFPMALFCIASMIFILRRVDNGGLRNSILAGLFGGLAASMKYPGALMAVPILMAHIRWKPFRVEFKHLIWAGAVMVVTFAALNPFIFVEWDLFRAHLAYESAHLMAPHEGIDLGRGWWYHPRFTFPMAMGTLVYFAAIGGLIWWAMRGGRKRWIIIITPIVFLLMLGRGKAVFFRYMASVFPFLAILAAGFVADLAGLLPWKSWSKAVMIAVFGLLLSIPSIARSVAIDHLLSKTDSRVEAARWLTTNLKPGTRVFLSGYFGMPPIVPHFFKYLKITDEREAGLYEKYRAAIAEFPAWNRYPLKVVQPEDIFPDLNAVAPTVELWRDSLKAWNIDWVVMDRYFLPFYSDYPVGLPEAVLMDFDEVATFLCLTPRVKSYPEFEMQDAFYLPVAGFHGIVRPGPNLYIFMR
jgi:hypothetical protein